MTRKATEQVTTIGIDIGKNTFHLVGFDGRSGSRADEIWLLVPRRLSGAEPTKSVEKPTSRPGGPLSVPNSPLRKALWDSCL